MTDMKMMEDHRNSRIWKWPTKNDGREWNFSTKNSANWDYIAM